MPSWLDIWEIWRLSASSLTSSKVQLNVFPSSVVTVTFSPAQFFQASAD